MLVTLYTKNECHLCDSLKADLLVLQPEVGFTFFEVDIYKADEAVQKYADFVPVLDIESGPLLYAPISYDELFDALDRAKENQMQNDLADCSKGQSAL